MSTEELCEVSLLRRWLSGDNGAGDQLLRRYTPVLRAFFRHKRASNVDELVQSTLVACIQAVGRFAERSSFKTYVMGIARNQFLMSLRCERADGIEPPPISTAPEDSPSRLLAFEEDRRFLLRALYHLPSEFREALTLLYWDGRLVEEIARELGVPVGTVKSRLARGRAALREEIDRMNLPSRPLAKLERLLEEHEGLR